MDLRCVLALCLTVVHASNIFAYDNCNQTIRAQRGSRTSNDDDPDGDAPMTLRMPRVRAEDKGKPLYCWFRFEGGRAQTVQVDVRDIRAGDYNAATRDCQKGFLRISDDESCSTDPEWLPPTTLCGHFGEGEVRVKRITRSKSAFVEFRLEKAKTSKGYEFDVTFVDKGQDEDDLPYGHLQRMTGRTPDTKCDWLVPVNDCFGPCHVVSPGFPGIYPPNIRCTYLLTNFDDSRVELSFGGRGFSGKFDMKRSENCSEDYVEVYDGMSTINPLIGRFCGHEGHHVISSRSSLLLIFQSGPGGPPWDYSGFDVTVTDRWPDHHEGGQKVPGSLCDWVFESADSEEGDLHTPDYNLKNTTECLYRFQADSNQKIMLKMVLNGLKPNCEESLEIRNHDGMTLDTICASKLTGTRQTFSYNTTGPTGSIVYRTTGQMSNPQPNWIYYTFWVDPLMPVPPPNQQGYKIDTEIGNDLQPVDGRTKTVSHDDSYGSPAFGQSQQSGSGTGGAKFNALSGRLMIAGLMLLRACF